jgi:hypothetical protein
MSRTIHILTIAGLVVCCALIPNDSARARPQYLRVFRGLYGKPDAKSEKASCTMCHPSRGKEKKNHYGAALEKELGERKVKDEKRIAEALRNLEPQKCATGEWGERLKKRLPPCRCRNTCDACRAQDTPSFSK